MEKKTATQTQEDLKLRALKEAGIAYSVSAVLPVLLSFVLVIVLSLVGGNHESDDWYLYLSFLLPQIGFALTAALFFKRSNVSLKATYCGCKWYYFLIALLLQFGLYFSLQGLNGYFVKLLHYFGYELQGIALPSLNGWNLLPAIVVIALLPALFEETLMRGILSKQMFENGWGLAVTVAISGALFSLFHHNPEQTLYQFCCGMCYTLLALRSGSVFPTMLAHFSNNAVILVAQSVFAPRFPENYDFGWADILPKEWYISLIVFSAVCLVGTLVYLIVFDKHNARKGKTKHGAAFAFTAAIGIAVFAIEWIMYLIMGFMPRG